ncbi:NAD-dependent epimerase/dehydratase family protein [Elusimicrobiota bacterium]
MKKILVTGGAGYKGSLLCPLLLERGYKVEIYDSFIWGVRPILHFINHPDLTITKGDIRDKEKVARSVKKADMVIHLAAIVGYPACSADPIGSETINVQGTLNVVNNMSKNQQLVFASTGSTYGRVDGVCDETAPISPLTIYGRTKAESEKHVLDFGGVNLRFATVFGVSPRLRLDLLVNDFCHKAYHYKYVVMFEGGHKRTFLHVLDSVKSYLTVIDNYETMKQDTFNIGSSDMNYTKRDVAQMINKFQDFYIHEAAVGHDADQRDYHVSYAKIDKIGFKAQISLEDGIKELLRVVPLIHISDEWRNA